MALIPKHALCCQIPKVMRAKFLLSDTKFKEYMFKYHLVNNATMYNIVNE